MNYQINKLYTHLQGFLRKQNIRREQKLFKWLLGQMGNTFESFALPLMCVVCSFGGQKES